MQFKNILEITQATLDHRNINYTQDDLVDISYIIFYYGLEGSWTTFILNKCKKYHFINSVTLKEIQQKLNQKIDKKLVRANQTYLSSYFRNMYNAIKMIDESDILTLEEKKNLIKILRAQLSNPELYILFFNIISRFGKKWIENNFIEKYELIKNIPYDYCEGYDPKIYFSSIEFEEDEY
ncbi:putative phage abortive infection protein [Acinetobacter pseudolwoffii]|nr:putative phage abortive infection protein [Acinetobacter pseudolwoffii]